MKKNNAPTLISLLLITAILTACRSTPMAPAPVIERSVSGVPSSNYPVGPVSYPTATHSTVYTGSTSNTISVPSTSPTINTTSTSTITQPRTGAIDGRTHTVKRGETLYSIALENGVGYRELAEWNGISNPSYIQINQVLRLTAPGSNAADVSSTGTGAQSTPIMMPNTGVASPPARPASAPIPVAADSGEPAWQWPARGRASPYVEGRSKGIDIPGNMGDAVAAAADGKVVYAGSALKGYGQMVIVKHNDVYLTAYAHNSKLLVREEQQVRRGQKIAEMGNTESDNGQIKLHFELRRSGKPVDPSRFLPAQ